jgi:para-aminobenzoate synthetase / 4-amino-4-deoxychorismate lyase
MLQPTVIVDDAAHGRVRAFGRPLGTIRADTPEEVPVALAALQTVWDMGLHAAGYFSYEMGYVLEPRLQPLLPRHRLAPLLWFGIFDPPKIVDAAALDPAFDGWCTGRAHAGPLRTEWREADYGERFDRAKALIAAGDFYQVNLTFRGGFAFYGDPLAFYRDLRTFSASAYGAYVDDGERRILSLSPELFFSLENGKLTARPMKGTAARHLDRDKDEAARNALAASVKDRAENLMIVDLMRNDLGRIAQSGSVAVKDLFAVETYPTVHQMVSTVTADLRQDAGIAAILRALFPCGSVTGAPKIRAMQAIRDLEGKARGIYCGAVGWFGPKYSARFNVAIRTLTISGGRGFFGIGGAVVQDSKSDAEYAEALLKCRFLAETRRPLELIETLRFVPGDGLVRCDLHVARMKRSAEFFAIAFDEQAARRALEGAVANATKTLRVRLTLDETGQFVCLAMPLPPGPACWTFAVSPKRLSGADLFVRHKTSLRETYDRERNRIVDRLGCDEVVFLNRDGFVAEGSRSTVFVKRDGKLLTPPLDAGALDGVLRRELVDSGEAVEAMLSPKDLTGEVFLGNSLRGLIRAAPIV